MLDNDVLKREIGLETHAGEGEGEGLFKMHVMNGKCNVRVPGRTTAVGPLSRPESTYMHVLLHWLALDSSHVAPSIRSQRGCEGFGGPKEYEARKNWNNVVHLSSDRWGSAVDTVLLSYLD
jgi:hypothetical protein